MLHFIYEREREFIGENAPFAESLLLKHAQTLPEKVENARIRAT
jgi:hypothetical protein